MLVWGVAVDSTYIVRKKRAMGTDRKGAASAHHPSVVHSHLV